MITLELRAQLAQGALSKLARQLADRRPANRALSIELDKMVEDNFEREAHDGQPWVELAPSTRRWKEKRGYDKILQNTRAMRQSFLPFYDNDVAGVGALSTKLHADISETHEKGLGHVPARPMLPSRARGLAGAIQVYGVFVERARRGAGL